MSSRSPKKSEPSWQILNIPKRRLESDISSVAINDSEFLVQTTGAFQKYDVVEDKWSRYPISVPKQLKGTNWKVKAYNRTTNSIYAVQKGRGRLTEFDVKTGSVRSMFSNLPFRCDTIFLIGDELHLFGYHRSYYRHLILNKALGNNQRFDLKLRVLEKGYSAVTAVVHSKPRNSILCVMDDGWNPVIDEYSLSTKQWNMRRCDSSLIMDEYVRYLKALCTADGRYLVILKNDIISICDLNESTLKLTAVRCPDVINVGEDREFHLLSMRDKWREEMATFGFVRGCFDCKQMKRVQQLPRYIIELIAKWVEMESIHLMQSWNFQIGHWKMSVNEMLEFGN